MHYVELEKQVAQDISHAVQAYPMADIDCVGMYPDAQMRQLFEFL